MAKSIDFIGIGAPRSATSWIANVLRAHPQICISEPKEVRYFNRYMMPVGPLKNNQNSNFDKDLDWYFRRFSHAKPGQILGEISPIYLSDPEAPAAIKACFPKTKLIVSLRNPIDRAFSFYKLHRGNSLIDDISFADALAQESVYIETGLYARLLQRYLEHFDQNQICILLFEKLIADPGTEFLRIFEFLGITPMKNVDFSSYRTNKSATRRSTILHKFAFNFSQRLIDAGMTKFLVTLRALGAHKLFNVFNYAPALNGEIGEPERHYLAAAFRADIQQLETMFNLDLIEWKQGLT